MKNFLKSLALGLMMLFLVFPFPSPAVAATASQKIKIIEKNQKLLDSYEKWLVTDTRKKASFGDYFDGKIPAALVKMAKFWDDFYEDYAYEEDITKLKGGVNDDGKSNLTFFGRKKGDVKGDDNDYFVEKYMDQMEKKCDVTVQLLTGRTTYGKKDRKGFVTVNKEFLQVAKLPDINSATLDKVVEGSTNLLKTTQQLLINENPCLYWISNIYRSLVEGKKDGDVNDDLECLAQKVYPGSKVTFIKKINNHKHLDGNLFGHAKNSQVKLLDDFVYIDFPGGDMCKDIKDPGIQTLPLDGCGAACVAKADADRSESKGGYYATEDSKKRPTADSRRINAHHKKMDDALNAYIALIAPFKEEVVKNIQELEASAKSALDKGSVVSLSLPFSSASPARLIGRIVNRIVQIVGAIALAFFVYGGFTYMTAAGNQERISKAKKNMVWAVLGLVVIFSAYAIVSFLITAVTGKSL